MKSNATSQPPDEAVGTSAVPSAETVARGYETTHISIRALLMVLLGLIVVCGAIAVGVWYLQGAMLRSDRGDDRVTSMIHVTPPDNNFPPLQPSGASHDTTPVQDLAAMRAAEDAVFDDVGWRDQKSGAIAVPAEVVRAVVTRTPPTTHPAGGGAE